LTERGKVFILLENPSILQRAANSRQLVLNAVNGKE
jgi:hypothetical protein